MYRKSASRMSVASVVADRLNAVMSCHSGSGWSSAFSFSFPSSTGCCSSSCSTEDPCNARKYTDGGSDVNKTDEVNSTVQKQIVSDKKQIFSQIFQLRSYFSYDYFFSFTFSYWVRLQCSDAVDWATGTACKKLSGADNNMLATSSASIALLLVLIQLEGLSPSKSDKWSWVEADSTDTSIGQWTMYVDVLRWCLQWASRVQEVPPAAIVPCTTWETDWLHDVCIGNTHSYIAINQSINQSIRTHGAVFLFSSFSYF